MKIAVINEVSASHRNSEIMEALKGSGHIVYNIGMKSPEEKPELTYIHTGLMAGMLLNANVVDFVIGGCGTGQGFLNSAVQYPGVFCGLIVDPLDGWLFTQINGGNCVALALNKGYGWAGDVNLKFIFEKLFACESGAGYPEHRKESQGQSRELLKRISGDSHRSMDEILETMDKDVLGRLAESKEFLKVLEEQESGKTDLLKYFK